MEISLFLAKVFAIYLVILGVAQIIHHKRFAQLSREIIRNRPLLLVAQIFGLMIVILIVVSHNVWTPDWRAIITIFGWLALIKASLFILAPDMITASYEKMMKRNFYVTTGVISIIIGLYLGSFGF